MKGAGSPLFQSSLASFRSAGVRTPRIVSGGMLGISFATKAAFFSSRRAKRQGWIEVFISCAPRAVEGAGPYNVISLFRSAGRAADTPQWPCPAPGG